MPCASMTRERVIRLAVLLGIASVLAVVLVVRWTTPPRGNALAFTECSWTDGPVVVMIGSRIAPEDTAPVRAHEEIHADQCDDLGWLRYHLRNLSVGGRLSLEAPGYCAGARERLRRGDDTAATRERMFDDAMAMFAGQADSARVGAALRGTCPELARNVH